MISSNNIGKVLSATDRGGITFVSTKYYSCRFVKIMLPHISQNTFLIGEVTSIDATNPYFESAKITRYIDAEDDSIHSQTLYISTVSTLGFYENDKKIEIDFPPAPGTNVMIPTDHEVQSALRLENEGLFIGSLKGTLDIKINISLTKLLRTHFSILGRTGSGKSYFGMGLMAKIHEVVGIEKNKMRFILFSPTAEYNKLASHLSSSVYNKANFSFPFSVSYLSYAYDLNFRERTIVERFISTSTIQAPISSRDLSSEFKNWASSGKNEFQKKKSQPALFPSVDSDAIDEIPQYVEAIASKFRQKDLIFSKNPFSMPLEESIVFDMSEFTTEAQELLISYVLHSLLIVHKKGDTVRSLVVIEEAHNYAPSVQGTICKDKIVQIAREGRKLKLNICLISQRPRHIDQTVLSQAGSLFLFNTSHPDDIKHISNTSPAYSPHMDESLRKLDVGECLVIGDVAQYPLVCKINFKER